MDGTGDREHDAPRREVERANQQAPRGAWSQRFVHTVRPIQPLKYERYAALDAGGTPRIIFRFDPPVSPSKMDPTVYSILKAHQRTDDGGGRHTGLKFERDRDHGKCFMLPADPFGYAIADHLDMDLLRLAAKMERSR